MEYVYILLREKRLKYHGEVLSQLKHRLGNNLFSHKLERRGKESPSTAGQGTLGNQGSQGQHLLGTESATENIPPRTFQALGMR